MCINTSVEQLVDDDNIRRKPYINQFITLDKYSTLRGFFLLRYVSDFPDVTKYGTAPYVYCARRRNRHIRYRQPYA